MAASDVPEAARLSRLLWDAREIAEMYADVVRARSDKDPDYLRRVVREMDEAVEAALADEWVSRVLSDHDAEDIARPMLAAAAPHLRAQVLAEVDAALRDEDAYAAWDRAQSLGSPNFYVPRSDRRTLAAYLADTLGAGGDGEG